MAPKGALATVIGRLVVRAALLTAAAALVWNFGSVMDDAYAATAAARAARALAIAHPAAARSATRPRAEMVARAAALTIAPEPRIDDTLVPPEPIVPAPAPTAPPAPPVVAAPPRPAVPMPASFPDQAHIVAAIEAAANEFGQDPAAMVAVATCETRLRPTAVGRAGEIGVFQFMPSTFARNGAILGYTLANIWDVRAQARVAAEMWRRGQQWQWTCAKKLGLAAH